MKKGKNNMIKKEQLLEEIKKDYLENPKIEILLSREKSTEDYLEYEISFKIANHILSVVIVEDGYESSLDIYEGDEWIVSLCESITDLDSCLDNFETNIINWLMLEKINLNQAKGLVLFLIIK